MIFEPDPLAQVLIDHGIDAVPVSSEEPDLEPHTVELKHGLSIVFNQEHLSLQQEIGSSFRDHGEFTNLSKLVGTVKEIFEEMT